MRELPEERRVLFPNYVVVALAGVELQRGTTRVTPGVGAAALSGNRGEPDQRVLLSARLEHRSLGVGADLWSPRMSEGPGTLRVGLALRNPLPVEVDHLLSRRWVGNPGIGCCGFAVVVFHGNTSFVRCSVTSK